MNSLLAFAVLAAWASSPAHGSLWDLQKMITKATGKNALLHYSFYSCYCGFGGRGQPKDATDRVQRYRYDWSSSSPSCRKGLWCSQLSCECDRSLALCLKRNVGSYRRRHQFYPKHLCR
ncbi:PREDICTED: calcium-dependent phospholipase A2-like [Nestor notabilis]|uniref:calcium-dependent phospholipase A2-like n=1 Tax=Nestor notabilis TaxID=176057 RepID=UPI000523DD03|nr:PREDICTED: calcium-dependent phospholipase A2-like [Nestor notabilis]